MDTSVRGHIDLWIHRDEYLDISVLEHIWLSSWTKLRAHRADLPRMQMLQVPSAENVENAKLSNILCSKREVGQDVALLSATKSTFVISAFQAHLTSFLPDPL